MLQKWRENPQHLVQKNGLFSFFHLMLEVTMPTKARIKLSLRQYSPTTLFLIKKTDVVTSQ